MSDHETSAYKAGETVQGGPWDGFEVISTYSRAQAIEDGNLIDVTGAAKPRGIRIPCAVSAAVWAHLAEGLDWESDQAENRVLLMRLHDVFAAIRQASAAQALQGPGGNSDRVFFKQGGQDLWAVVGPGDDARPVMTIMMLGED